MAARTLGQGSARGKVLERQEGFTTSRKPPRSIQIVRRLLVPRLMDAAERSGPAADSPPLTLDRGLQPARTSRPALARSTKREEAGTQTRAQPRRARRSRSGARQACRPPRAPCERARMASPPCRPPQCRRRRGALAAGATARSAAVRRTGGAGRGAAGDGQGPRPGGDCTMTGGRSPGGRAEPHAGAPGARHRRHGSGVISVPA
jgi:hypothetical protein